MLSFLVVVRYGLDTLHELLNNTYLKKVKYIIDYVFPSNIDNVLIKSIYNSSKNKVLLESFSVKRKYNSCLNNSLAILPDGCIVPCLGLWENRIGSIKQLSEVFSDKLLYKYWELNVNKITPCNNCGMRYLCNDCRSLELRLGGDLFSKKSCPINNYKEY